LFTFPKGLTLPSVLAVFSTTFDGLADVPLYASSGTSTVNLPLPLYCCIAVSIGYGAEFNSFHLAKDLSPNLPSATNPFCCCHAFMSSIDLKLGFVYYALDNQ
jgi:hypothetical protein